MLGGSFLFTISNRNQWEKCADTYKACEKAGVPIREWGASARRHRIVPRGGGGDGRDALHEFEHGACVYILGAEDAGLPASIMRVPSASRLRDACVVVQCRRRRHAGAHDASAREAMRGSERAGGGARDVGGVAGEIESARSGARHR